MGIPRALRVRSTWRPALIALTGLGTISGCRGPQTLHIASVSIKVPAVWHEYTADGAAYKTALHLERNGIPMREKGSYISIYVPDENELNSVKSAQLWQQRTEKNNPENSVSRHAEQLGSRYVSWCVTGVNRNDWHVIDCAVQDTPLMFSFSGSSEGEAEAREILWSMH